MTQACSLQVATCCSVKIIKNIQISYDDSCLKPFKTNIFLHCFIMYVKSYEIQTALLDRAFLIFDEYVNRIITEAMNEVKLASLAEVSSQ